MSSLQRRLRQLLLALGSMSLFLLPLQVHAAPETKKTPQNIESRIPVLVEFTEPVDSPRSKAKALAEQYSARVVRVYEHAVRGMNLDVPEDQLEQLLEEESISTLSHEKRLSAANNQKHSSNASASSEDSEKNTTNPRKTQVIPAGIKRVNAHKVEDYEPHSDVNVAVVDSGISKDHPDLKKNLKGGVNFLRQGDKNDWGSTNRHGTHVAGTIAARDNDRGVVGVAPRANLFSVRVINPDNMVSTSGAIVKGLDWVANPSNNIDVANVSLGGLAIRRLIGLDMIGKAAKGAVDNGVAVVTAAGNSSRPAITSSPAGYDDVTTVTAINPRNDQFAEFSNYGMTTTVIAAPGVDTLSTIQPIYGGYGRLDGTSMAAPHVAGGMALLLGANPDLTPQELENVMLHEGMSVQWKNHPGLASGSEPLMDAKEMANGVNRPENKQPYQNPDNSGGLINTASKVLDTLTGSSDQDSEMAENPETMTTKELFKKILNR